MPDRRTAVPATTDQTTKRSLDSEPETEQETKSWLDLSLTQVMGGALAAMTAAALGSRFSVAGTVVGAALASVIAALATALYTASLRRTGETVRAVLGGRPTDAARIESPSGQAQPVSGVSAAVAPRWLPSLEGTVDRSARASRRRALILKSVVGAAATFALAAGAVTMYEALSGHALSGGSGTTFSQVQQRGREDRPTDEQAPAPSESADPSPTAEASAEPSVTPQAEPSPTAEPSTEPSAEPSAEPSVTPEAEPSATAAPPSAAPSQPPQPPR
ncbi:MAG TPA: hypothetical protein VGW74_04560 [Propionibacteriaceae bacterium]|nr:hypothetical protein [Propionibacteriaceae bacterium]